MKQNGSELNRKPGSIASTSPPSQVLSTRGNARHPRFATRQSLRVLTAWWIGPCTATFALMLTGCANFGTQSDRQVPIPPNLLQTCPDLEAPQEGTGKVLLRTMIQWAQQYQDCQARHDQLVKALGLREQAVSPSQP